jgi:DNA-binding transcriptional LysR family regulator
VTRPFLETVQGRAAPDPRGPDRRDGEDRAMPPKGHIPSIRHLRVFEAVARLQSVTKAAEEIRLSQPALTQTIVKLEAEFGRQLLDRRVTGTYPTEFGKKLLAPTRRFFQRIETAVAEISPPNDKASILRKVFRITRSQIRCHVMIARSTSFAHAATELGISQPSLHKAARDLEACLGVGLYRTSATGLIATEAGQILAGGLVRGIEEMRSAARELSAGGAPPSNCIVIGVPILDPAPFLAVVMEAFTAASPESTVKVVNSTFEDLRQRIRIGLMDFMIGVIKDDSPDLLHEPLFADPYVVAAREDHPLVGRGFVSAEQLTGYDWLVARPGAPRRAAFDRLFQGLGRGPRTSIETHSYATIRATLCEGDRLAIMTRSELLPDQRMGLLDAVATDPLEPTPIIGLTTRPGWAPSQKHQLFLSLLRRHAARLAVANEGAPAEAPAKAGPALRTIGRARGS